MFYFALLFIPLTFGIALGYFLADYVYDYINEIDE